MATFQFDLVSPEKLAFSGEVDQVDIPGVEGDFGVLAGHAPVIAAIRPGIITVHAGGNREKIIVTGGIAEVNENGLTVLAAAGHGENAGPDRGHDRRMSRQHAEVTLDAGDIDLIDFAREGELFRRDEIEVEGGHWKPANGE